MGHLKSMPLPTFRIDRALHVLECSDSAVRRFGNQWHLASIVDEGSQRKLMKLQEQSTTVEMALLTVGLKPEAFSVSIQWETDEAYVQCVELDRKLARLEQMVRQQQQRLAEADFQLMEKKEEAEAVLVKMKERSAPLIALSNSTALIPMFGDLDSALMEHTKDALSHGFYERDFEQLYIDFTAVDTITMSGIEQFNQLVDILLLLDASIRIVGVKPTHAPFLKNHRHSGLIYASSIQIKSESLS
ncbi:STAS domain-containing protein [Domibacillus robiginosus]|uniref:STAS domain-containing protein n=1 Tax=Domibacillus robiginosus TaxID=1071054 RepID=UPI00067C68FB|nr:STAS domain-containing protein [Domibacillus robiginosus]